MGKGYVGQVRIVGGRLRGRKLAVLPAPGLRPTPDRVRETLFNWLQPRLVRARCLDLFAGTGALGFEADSRGARQVVLVERDRRLAEALRVSARSLDARGACVKHQEAQAFLRGVAEPFDIVFLDPPFGSALLAPTCRQLEYYGWLTPDAWIYVESGISLPCLDLPENWSIAREKRAGQVSYGIAARTSAAN